MWQELMRDKRENKKKTQYRLCWGLEHKERGLEIKQKMLNTLKEKYADSLTMNEKPWKSPFFCKISRKGKEKLRGTLGIFGEKR